VSNITLPRAVVEQVRKALEAMQSYAAAERKGLRICDEAVITITAALAEPERHVSLVCPQCNWTLQEQEPEKERAETVIPARSVADRKASILTPESYRTTEPTAKPEPVHPGYIIGSHWLETAYSRIAAGEAEADVLTEVLGARGWVNPEPATDEQVVEADENHEPSWIDYRDGWRAAERWHGITKEDKT